MRLREVGLGTGKDVDEEEEKGVDSCDDDDAELLGGR